MIVRSHICTIFIYCQPIVGNTTGRCLALIMPIRHSLNSILPLIVMTYEDIGLSWQSVWGITECSDIWVYIHIRTAYILSLILKNFIVLMKWNLHIQQSTPFAPVLLCGDHIQRQWRHDTETLPAQLFLITYERNPLIICGFPSQRASDVELWCFLC